MISKELEIQNKLGLHARVAALIVQTLNKFQSETYLIKDGERVNGKSIMGVLMLAATKGSKIKVEIEGEDADKAMKAFEDLINSKFGEE
ncbi:MAG: HPr family phosphocarrier protein [Candidatus Hydrogenedentota bacterium]